MHTLLLGATAMASLVAALFFWRFWRQTRDRFFLLFALAFGVDSLDRVALGALGALGTLDQDHEPLAYLARLVTFGLILAAVIDKNLRRNRRK